MQLLADTCTALWYWGGDPRLSANAEAALRDGPNEVVFHQVSYLEITLKYSLGKLPLALAPAILIPEALRAYRFQYARLSNRDIAGLESLPFHHRDPFDRILISHAIDKGLTIVTPDAHIAGYGVPVIW